MKKKYFISGVVTGLSGAPPLGMTIDNEFLWPKVTRIQIIEAMRGRKYLVYQRRDYGIDKRGKKIEYPCVEVFGVGKELTYNQVLTTRSVIGREIKNKLEKRGLEARIRLLGFKGEVRFI